MRKNLLFFLCIFLALQNKAQTVTDADGNVYNTVTIGTQVWMKENLKTTKFNDGTSIPYVTDTNEWYTTTSSAYCWYNNNITNKALYGAMYNWYTVNTGKVCPVGWHVPSTDDWNTLVSYLGGEDIAGNMLKEAGSIHWTDNNMGNNSSGFTALPGGQRKIVGYSNNKTLIGFSNIGLVGAWWSTTSNNSTDADIFEAASNESYILFFANNKYLGINIRCLNDNITPVEIQEPEEESIKISPNPASDKLYINTNNHLNSRAIIIDLQGKQVLDAQTDGKPIDISNLARGIYLVKIMDSGYSFVKTLIKQ